MDFNQITNITIPEDEIKSLAINGQTVWSNQSDLPDYLCFTSAVDGNKMSLKKQGTLTHGQAVEYSYDGITWTAYTFGTALSFDAGEKIYWRGDNTAIGESGTAYLHFGMDGDLYCSGNVMSLLDKTCESLKIDTSYCFYDLFYNCTHLLTPPKCPATTLDTYCYRNMFYGCTNLTKIVNLPCLAFTTSANGHCYESMFDGCSKIKISESKTGAYQYPIRIPPTGTIGMTASNFMRYMFRNTGGTFKSTPSFNTTYYTTEEPV